MKCYFIRTSEEFQCLCRPTCVAKGPMDKKGIRSFETSVPVYESPRSDIQQDLNLREYSLVKLEKNYL